MKKICICILLLLTTGCSVARIDTNKIDTITKAVLSKNNTLYNRIGKGYKYYKPRGVSYIDTSELNDVLYSKGNYYYLYIDAVGYYYKTKIKYEENKDAYYSKKLDGGYIEILEQNGRYHITFVYNYAKIEAVVKKEDINNVILDATYILSTIKYNDKIIAVMLNDEYFINREEQYNKFKKKEEATNSFTLKYTEETEK